LRMEPMRSASRFLVIKNPPLNIAKGEENVL